MSVPQTVRHSPPKNHKSHFRFIRIGSARAVSVPLKNLVQRQAERPACVGEGFTRWPLSNCCERRAAGGPDSLAIRTADRPRRGRASCRVAARVREPGLPAFDASLVAKTTYSDGDGDSVSNTPLGFFVGDGAGVPG